MAKITNEPLIRIDTTYEQNKESFQEFIDEYMQYKRDSISSAINALEEKMKLIR
jgi:hypothetical protein